MPAGLDGNPDPIRTAERDLVLSMVAEKVLTADRDRVLVGVDGRSGSGKSTFADELARELEGRGRHVIRSTTDSFHRPREERLRRGATSAEGYYLDAHQLDRIVNELLIPFRDGTDRVTTAAFDEPTDTHVDQVVEVASEAILVFDGLFVHRPELVQFWDVSIYLDTDERRDTEWLAFLLDDLPLAPTERATEIDHRLDLARWPRYRHGWTSYVNDVNPAGRATVVVDNNDISRPTVLANR